MSIYNSVRVYKRGCTSELLMHAEKCDDYTFSAFWLRSSVVSVLISVKTGIFPTGKLFHMNFFRETEPRIVYNVSLDTSLPQLCTYAVDSEPFQCKKYNQLEIINEAECLKKSINLMFPSSELSSMLFGVFSFVTGIPKSLHLETPIVFARWSSEQF